MKQGKLALIKRTEVYRTPNGSLKPKGLYKCECGNEVELRVYDVNSGRTKSCGCLMPNRTKHGMCGGTTHKRWQDMKGRCRPTAKRADRYYDRGIGYCLEWETFPPFYADMGECPEGYELDRVDNDKGYSKENCQWVDRSMNMRNRTESNKRQSIGTIQNVFWNRHRHKFQVHCAHQGKRKYLGQYDSEEEGRQAYNTFAAKHGYPLREKI